MIKRNYQPFTVLLQQLKTPYTKGDIVAAVVTLIVVGFLMSSDISVTEKVVAVFGAGVIIVRTGSFLCFILAAVCLVNIIALLVIGRGQLAEALAIYVFYFMLIGAISLLLENSPGKKYAELETKFLKRKQ